MPLKTTMDINHTNLKERFEFLMTLGKNSSILVEEVNKKIGPIEVELKKMLMEQQSKDIEASAVKNSVETIRGNVHKFFTYFCNIFKCDHLKMSPSTIAPNGNSAPKSPAPNGNSAPNVPNTNSKPNANSTPIVNPVPATPTVN
jgi:activator of HSP90 ATPase